MFQSVFRTLPVSSRLIESKRTEIERCTGRQRQRDTVCVRLSLVSEGVSTPTTPVQPNRTNGTGIVGLAVQHGELYRAVLKAGLFRKPQARAGYSV